MIKKKYYTVITHLPNDDDDDWKVGKSVVDIKFVKRAEDALQKLQRTIDDIKNGKKHVTDFTTISSIIDKDILPEI